MGFGDQLGKVAGGFSLTRPLGTAVGHLSDLRGGLAGEDPIRRRERAEAIAIAEREALAQRLGLDNTPTGQSNPFQDAASELTLGMVPLSEGPQFPTFGQGQLGAANEGLTAGQRRLLSAQPKDLIDIVSAKDFILDEGQVSRSGLTGDVTGVGQPKSFAPRGPESDAGGVFVDESLGRFGVPGSPEALAARERELKRLEDKRAGVSVNVGPRSGVTKPTQNKIEAESFEAGNLREQLGFIRREWDRVGDSVLTIGGKMKASAIGAASSVFGKDAIPPQFVEFVEGKIGLQGRTMDYFTNVLLGRSGVAVNPTELERAKDFLVNTSSDNPIEFDIKLRTLFLNADLFLARMKMAEDKGIKPWLVRSADLAGVLQSEGQAINDALLQKGMDEQEALATTATIMESQYNISPGGYIPLVKEIKMGRLRLFEANDYVEKADLRPSDRDESKLDLSDLGAEVEE